MFCENCGNNIPEGVTSCPNCGFQVYNSEPVDDMEALLSELSVALDDLSGDKQTDTAQQSTVIIPEIPVAAPVPEVPAEEAPADGNFIGDVFAGMDEQEPEPPVQATRNPKVKKLDTAPAEKKPAEAAKKKKKPAESGKKSSGKKKKKKKKKSGGGSAVLGVIIGLLVALLLIALAAGFMLYKMGFFTTLKSSDDELLNQTAVSSVQEPAEGTTVVPQAVETSPEVSLLPSPSAEPTATPTPEPSPEPEEEKIEPATRFLLTSDSDVYFYSRGSNVTIEYEIEPESAKERIEWKSDNALIADVSETGMITARRGGKCVITGTCDDLTVTIDVNCDFTVPDTVLDMNYEDVTMSYEGQTIQLEIDYDGLTLAQKDATVWESSDETIATVDEDGVVTAVSDGIAVISASIKDYTASCIIRCVGVTGNAGVNSAQSEYVINYEDVTLTRKGEYFQLSLSSITGNDVPEYTWRSSDKSVATVNRDGVVTAVGNGTAYITTTVDGYDFECIVRVSY